MEIDYGKDRTLEDEIRETLEAYTFSLEHKRGNEKRITESVIRRILVLVDDEIKK